MDQMYDIFGDLVTARKMPRVGEVREILLQNQGYSHSRSAKQVVDKIRNMIDKILRIPGFWRMISYCRG